MTARNQRKTLPCSEARSLLERMVISELSAEEERLLAEHLATCEACSSSYAERVRDEQAGIEEGRFYISGRPVWGTLSLGLREIEELEDDISLKAFSLEKTGGLILIKYNPSLELPLVFLLTRLRSALRREEKQVIGLSPTTHMFFLPFLQAQNAAKPLYVVAPHVTRFGDFPEIAEALAEGKNKTVVIATATAEEWTDDIALFLSPVLYALDSSPSQKTRFHGELKAETEREWQQARQDGNFLTAYATVALLDALGVPTPVPLLARKLGKSVADVRALQSRAKGLLFWLGTAQDPHAFMCTSGEAIAREISKLAEEDESRILEEYGAVIGVASNEERETVLKLLLSLAKHGKKRLAKRLIETHWQTIHALFSKGTPRELLALGKLLEELFLSERAEEIFAQGLGIDRNNLYLRHALARLYGLLGRFDEAERGFAALRQEESTSRSPYLWQSWGDLERRRGRISIARERFSEALRQDPANIPTLVASAVLELEEGTLERARYWAEEALKQDSRSVYALNVLGRIEAKERDYGKALEYWNRALLIDSFNVPTLNARAGAEKELGHLKSAEDNLEKVLSIDPENLHSLIALADLQIEVGKITGAKEAYSVAERGLAKVLELDSQNIQALVTLGVLKTEAGDFGAAEEAFRRGRDINDCSAYLQTAWGEMERKRNNYPMAEHFFETVLRREPSNTAALNVMARLRAEQERLEEARRNFRKSLEHDQRNVRTLNAWAEIEEKHGDKSEAHKLLRRSLDLDPDNAYTHSQYAELLRKMGEDREAEFHFQRAESLGLFLSGKASPGKKLSLETGKMTQLMTVEEADTLYERYGKPLEREHHGGYAAITQDGRRIVGKDDIDVMDRAMREFGSGNFVLYRVGYKYVGKIRRSRCLLAMTTHFWR